MDRIEVGGLKVARILHDFVVNEALPGTGVEPGAFWSGLAAIVRDMAPRNRALLDHRDALQAKVDDYHKANAGRSVSMRSSTRRPMRAITVIDATT